MKRSKWSSPSSASGHTQHSERLEEMLRKNASRRQVLKFLAATAGTGLVAQGLRSSSHEARAVAPANDSFSRTWARTDKPVADGMISRTWMWGPEAFTAELIEDYVESPNGQRKVQYFDKSRMEITHPDALDDGLWYVTNGLLVVELITGNMQMGDATFEPHEPALVNVAGDPGGKPTYADFQSVLDDPPLPEGTTITQRMNADGTVTTDAALAGRGIIASHLVTDTSHTVAGPFWEFMNSTGMVYQNGAFGNDLLFNNPFYATGLPISEAFWANILVGGTARDVLVQCFERRVLTYTPDNPLGWQVEAGNVGQHYYQWRYGSGPGPTPSPSPSPSPSPTPEPDGLFCVPASSDHKPKTDPATKLAMLADTVPVSSSLAGAFFQMSRRYLMSASPANDLESAAFAAFDNLSPELKNILQCSVGHFDMLPEDQRTTVFGDYGTGDAPVDPDELVVAMGEELITLTSMHLFGDGMCLEGETPGKARPISNFDGGASYVPLIFRINGLRTMEWGLATAAEFLPEEFERSCTVSSVGTEDPQIVCEAVQAPCPGNMIENSCLIVPNVRQGDTVMLTGLNYYNVDGTVRFEGPVNREVPAFVCGDQETPVIEMVNGFEHIIIDNRVHDQIAFTVPMDLPTGVYIIRIAMPNTTGEYPGTTEWVSGANEYIRVVPSPTATFQVASGELYCDEETSPGSFGSDEVGLRAIAIPIGFDGKPGDHQETDFGIFGDVDSDNTRDITRTLFQGNNIAGIALALIGYEVDDEDAYEQQVQGFIDAFVFVMKSSWHLLADAIGGVAAGIAGLALGLSGAWITAIAAAVALVITAFIAAWAPADLIIQDTIGLTTIDLDMLTSTSYGIPPGSTYESPDGIDVTVEPVSKNVDYHEFRWYVSDAEDSKYRISLAYSRST